MEKAVIRGIEIGVLFVIILVGFFFGYISLRNGNYEHENWIGYSSSEFSYELGHPENWIREVNYSGGLVNLRSISPEDGYVRAITLNFLSSENYGPPTEFLENKLSDLNKNWRYENSTFEIENTSLNGYEAKEVTIDNILKKIENKKFVLRQEYIVSFVDIESDNYIFTLLFSAEENDIEAWSTLYPNFSKNFRFT